MATKAWAMKAFGFLVVAGVLVAGSVLPASAEFFGCNEPRTKVSYSSPRPSAYRTSFTRSYAVPRQRHAAYSSQSQRRFASQWH